MRVGIAAAVVLLGTAASSALADDIRVPGDFRRLRDALEAAEPGDRILLEAGVHRGPFTIAVDDLVLKGDGGRIVQGRAARRSRDAADDAVLVVRADHVTLAGLTISGGGIRIEGEGARVEHCFVERFADRRHAACGIEVRGSGARIRDSDLIAGRGSSRGVHATGSGVSVRGVSFVGLRGGRGVAIEGDGASVSANRFSDLQGGAAVAVEGDLAVIQDNRVEFLEGDEGALLVRGDGAVVARNAVDADRLGGPSVYLLGSDGLVQENDALADEGTGIVVRGHRNGVRDNIVAGDTARFSREMARWGHGIAVRGNENVLDGNRLFTIPADAIRLVGGSRNAVDGCSAFAAGACGLLNCDTDTSVTGSSFASSATDVVNAGSFRIFDGNEFTTGSTDTTVFGGPTAFDDDFGILEEFMPPPGSRD